jgi:hypothetical protein
VEPLAGEEHLGPPPLNPVSDLPRTRPSDPPLPPLAASAHHRPADLAVPCHLSEVPLVEPEVVLVVGQPVGLAPLLQPRPLVTLLLR